MNDGVEWCEEAYRNGKLIVSSHSQLSCCSDTRHQESEGMLARAQGVRAKCRGSRGHSPLLVSSVSLGPPQPGRIPNNVRFAQNGNPASNSPTDSAKAPLFPYSISKILHPFLLRSPLQQCSHRQSQETEHTENQILTRDRRRTTFVTVHQGANESSAPFKRTIQGHQLFIRDLQTSKMYRYTYLI